MSIWVVKPEEVKIDLNYVAPDGSSNPFWIKVKKGLTVGEQRRVMTAGWKGMSNTQGTSEISIDWKTQTFARTEAYLTDWSLSNDEGKTLALSRASIESLHGDVYSIIEEAINAHVRALEEEKKQKNSNA